MSELIAEEKTEAPSISAVRQEEVQEIREWLEGLAAGAEVKVTVQRKKPKVYKGVNIAGTLDNFEELIGEEDIKERFGGGQYSLKVQKKNAKGRWQYITTRTLEIAGPPKIEEYLDDEPQPAVAAAAPPDSDLVRQAMDMTNTQLLQAQERAEKAQSQGLDIGAIQTLMAPFTAQLEVSQRETAELRKQMIEMAGKKPDDSPFRDLTMKMYDGENARLNTLRDQHQSELRMLKEAHSNEIRQARENSRDDMKDRNRAHEREIETVRQSYQAQTEAAKVALESRIDFLKSETGRLEREILETKSEIGSLRARKDQSITDKADELMKIKEALGVFGGDEGSDEPWYQKALDTALSSPAAMRLASALTQEAKSEESPPPPQPQQQLIPPTQGGEGQQLPPVGQPFSQDGQTFYVRTPEDRIVQITTEQAQEMIESHEGSAPDSGTKPPSPEQIKQAVNFMETAISVGTEPEEFARTARNLIPADILRYLEEVGIDEFLNKTAKLSGESPLRTEYGRDFAQKVSKFLLTGKTE